MSFRTDPTRPLNYSREYLLAFHKAQDFQADFWSLIEHRPRLSQHVKFRGFPFSLPSYCKVVG